MTQEKTRLLVVDDDRAILSMLVAGLTRAGFDVVVATNADEARRMTAEARPALAVLDVQMQGHHGFEVADFLAREARVPFLCLVTPRDEEDQERAASSGAADVLAKPVNLTKLVPAIRLALQHAHEPARAAEAPDIPADLLGGGHEPQTLIAIGILAERHKVNCDEAVRLLRNRAEKAGRPIDEEALVVIEQAESAARVPV